jgi:hypothetical protein
MLNLGREATVEALGQTWRVARQELALFSKFIDWVKEQVGDPFSAAEKYMDRASPAVAALLVRDAKEEADALAKRDWGSRVVQRYAQSTSGRVRLFLLQLQVNHPDATEQQAVDILAEIGQQEAARVHRETAGEAPPGNV